MTDELPHYDLLAVDLGRVFVLPPCLREACDYYGWTQPIGLSVRASLVYRWQRALYWSVQPVDHPVTRLAWNQNQPKAGQLPDGTFWCGHDDCGQLLQTQADLLAGDLEMTPEFFSHLFDRWPGPSYRYLEPVPTTKVIPLVKLRAELRAFRAREAS